MWKKPNKVDPTADLYRYLQAQVQDLHLFYIGIASTSTVFASDLDWYLQVQVQYLHPTGIR